ncbi:hypothetical protein [Bradyrhizobium elkanii]|uniref:hypothetical protein n=1 Tax=Bradyrhizobium elkanii TaxID=29448 RepID=UPI00114D12E6|nr:hypothetical protein [Bradyrhizobium elkanii]
MRQQLRGKPGQRSSETKAALAERDRLVRELAASCYPGFCRHQQAVHIHNDLARYSSTWVRTRADAECRHADRRRRLLWQMLRLRGGHVPSVRLLDDVLACRTRR